MQATSFYPDPLTVSAVVGFVLTALTVFGVLLGSKYWMYRGFGRWTAASALTSVGLFIVVLRPTTFIWTNLLFVVARILTVEGNRAFRGKSPRLPWMYLAGAAAYISAVHFEHAHNANARIISMSSFDALAGFVSATVLLANPPVGRRLGLRFTGGMFSLYATIYVARVVYFASIPRLPVRLFSPSSPVGSVLSVSGPVLFLCCLVGWFVMNYERLLVDLKEQEAKTQAMAQRAAAADAAKSEFLAVIGHEIRNPLSAVLSVTDLMLQADLTAELENCVRDVRISTQALLRVSDDILDLSKIESGRLPIESSEFDLFSMTDAIGNLFRPIAMKKGLGLAVDYDPALPRLFMGDAGRIRQVITNLVSNAIKFTKTGQIRIATVLDNALGTGGAFRVSVTDNGIGIPPEQMGTIFEKFSTAHQSTSPKYGGSGIGLAISKKLIELMGGRLTVESQIGKGSTFWIELALPVVTQTSKVSNNK